MNTPPIGYLEAVSQGMAAPAAPLASVAPVGVLAPPPEMPPPEPPQAPIGPPPPPAPQPTDGPLMSVEPAPPEALPAVPQRPFPLLRVGGSGVVPEHEKDFRAPTVKAAQELAGQVNAGAVQSIDQRSQEAAALEYQMALDQQRQAQAREQAIMQAQAERDEEMQSRLADVDSSAKALSQSSMDPERFWASRSTGQKVAGLLAIGLGGFVQGARGGPNMGLDIIDQAINRDLKAQEFDYLARRNALEGKQTAFAMAMQKYGNQDAARAMARVASLDAVAGQLGQMKAIYAGTEAANRADAALAQLADRRKDEVAQAVRLIPAQGSGPVFIDPRTGVTYTNKEAQGVVKEWDAAENDRGKIALTTAGNVILEGTKAQTERAKADKDAAKAVVILPNGDKVQAPDKEEAGQLRAMAANANEVRKLVDQAKRIRSNPSWTVSPTDKRELDRIQANLVTAFGVAKKLGALSAPDRELADAASGVASGIGFGISDTLESYAKQTDEAWRARVKTYDGAPDSARGVMPASFKPAGKK